jgi:hypothetical protein
MSNIFSGNTFVKISELDETIEFDSSDEFVVVNDSVTQKITGLNLTESIVSIGNLASRAYVDAVVDGAPALLDTLNELASALNDDANFATNIIASIGTKLSTANFGLEFSSALAAKTTSDVTEGTNLYYTEQRVLDVINLLPPDPADRLINGEKEVVLQSNGYIRLVNGAQLYDYGSGAGNGYGITDATNGTYIGYDPTDTLGALHMDSYTGGNIRIRTTTLPNTYKDWLFSADGKLTLPADPTSDNHAATKGYVDNQVTDVIAGQGFATLDYVEDAIAGTIVDVTGTADDFDGILGISSGNSTNPVFQSLTTSTLNVEDIIFTGAGHVSFTSGSDLAFVAAGNITFNNERMISLPELKTVVAASSDFADFKSRIAAL